VGDVGVIDNQSRWFFLFVKKQGLFNLYTINIGQVQWSSWIIDCMEELPINKHATIMFALLMCTNMFTYSCPLSQLHALVGIQTLVEKPLFATTFSTIFQLQT
jgi:hypothetical protein